MPPHAPWSRPIQKQCQSHNCFVCSVQGMSCLTELDLQGNGLTRLEDINLLRKHTPRLTLLNLHGTPLADQRGQRLLALRRLPQVGLSWQCLHVPPGWPCAGCHR